MGRAPRPTTPRRPVRRLAALAALVLAAGACGGDGRTVLTVYSPHGKDLLQYYEQGFERAHPDVNCASTLRVATRLRARDRVDDGATDANGAGNHL